MARAVVRPAVLLARRIYGCLDQEVGGPRPGDEPMDMWIRKSVARDLLSSQMSSQVSSQLSSQLSSQRGESIVVSVQEVP